MVIQIHTNPDRFKNRDRTVSSGDFAKNNSAADISFKGSPFKMSESAKKKFYTSKGLQKFVKLTANPALLDATVVLGLACFLRPLTILNIPGTDKRDAQYASAHGIVSGVWGYVAALIATNPINKAVKNVCQKVKDDPAYLKNTFIKNSPKNREAFNFVASYGPKLILQPIVAAVTIALIPAAMGLLFKKKDGDKTQKTKVDESSKVVAKAPKPVKVMNSTFKSFDTNNNTSQIQFKGQMPKKPRPSRFVQSIEPLIEKMAQNKYIKKFSEKMAKDETPKDKKTSSMMRNLLTTGQALLGTIVYVFSTMKNPKIEEENKKTLAANQFITWGISAIGSVLLNNTIQKNFDRIAENYRKYNTENLEQNLEKITQEKLKKSIVTTLEKEKVKAEHLEKLKFQKSNIAKVAPTMIAFAFIYRYLTPVLATPLANLYKKHFINEPSPKNQLAKA